MACHIDFYILLTVISVQTLPEKKTKQINKRIFHPHRLIVLSQAFHTRTERNNFNLKRERERESRTPSPNTIKSINKKFQPNSIPYQLLPILNLPIIPKFLKLPPQCLHRQTNPRTTSSTRRRFYPLTAPTTTALTVRAADPSGDRASARLPDSFGTPAAVARCGSRR